MGDTPFGFAGDVLFAFAGRFAFGFRVAVFRAAAFFTAARFFTGLARAFAFDRGLSLFFAFLLAFAFAMLSKPPTSGKNLGAPGLGLIRVHEFVEIEDHATHLHEGLPPGRNAICPWRRWQCRSRHSLDERR